MLQSRGSQRVSASRGPGAPLGPQPQEARPPRAPGASDFPRTWVGRLPWVLGPLSPCKGQCPHLAMLFTMPGIAVGILTGRILCGVNPGEKHEAKLGAAD